MKKTIIVLALASVLILSGCGKVAKETGSSSGGGSSPSSPITTLSVSGKVTVPASNYVASYTQEMQSFLASIIVSKVYADDPVQDLDGATVKVFQFTENGLVEQPALQTVTNSTGNYTVSGLSASGLYVIEVSKSGIQSIKEYAFVYGSGDQTIDVTPKSSMSVYGVMNSLGELGAFKHMDITTVTNYITYINSGIAGQFASTSFPDFNDETAVLDASWTAMNTLATGGTSSTYQSYTSAILDNAFANDSYTMPVENAAWSELNSVSKWDGIEVVATDPINDTKAVVGFTAIDLKEYKLAKTSDGATLNILITMKDPLPAPSSVWEGTNSGTMHVNNKGLIRFEMKNKKAFYGSSEAFDIQAKVYIYSDGTQWVAKYMINGSGAGSFSTVILPIVNYGDSIEIAVPMIANMTTYPMYISPAVIAFGSDSSKWWRWTNIDNIYYSKINM